MFIVMRVFFSFHQKSGVNDKREVKNSIEISDQDIFFFIFFLDALCEILIVFVMNSCLVFFY